MTNITLEKLEEIRQDLPDAPEVYEVIKAIEDCDGNLEESTALLAVRLGESVTMGDSILDELVVKARQHLCNPQNKDGWSDLKDIIDVLKDCLPYPAPLIVICTIKLSEIGLRNFCKS